MSATNSPWILGIASSHNGGMCLLDGDRIAVAIQEERLTRTKRAFIHAGLPSLSLRYCLESAKIGPADLAYVVTSAVNGNRLPHADVSLHAELALVRNRVPFAAVSHHFAHAVSVFATSGWNDAAVLVVDGCGSPTEDLSAEESAVIVNPTPTFAREIISTYAASGVRIEPLEKHLVEGGDATPQRTADGMPEFRSLGGLFNAVGHQIFSSSMDGPGKVMGLAPYGTPNIPVHAFFEIVDGVFKFSTKVPDRFGHAERWPSRKNEYADLAASVQVALEEALIFLTRRLRERTGSDRLCYAGGVALNSVANERIIRESGFKDVYILPAAEDSGTAIGAAYWGLWQVTGKNTRRSLRCDSLGRTYGEDEILRAIAETPKVTSFRASSVVAETVSRLMDGQIVGWLQAGSELGPRSLGQRSILCDPRRAEMKDTLNLRVKHRERFRPFAPIVLFEEASNWFDLGGSSPGSPFMLRIAPFAQGKRELVPAVVHADGTGRLQTVRQDDNPLLYELVAEFHRRTGVPIVLNTSFNVAGEPIVETPDDALWCLLFTGVDVCVLGDHVITKKPDYGSILDLYVRSEAIAMMLHQPAEGGRIGSVPEKIVNPANPWVPWVRAVRGDELESLSERSFPTVLLRCRTPWGEITVETHPNSLSLLRRATGALTARALFGIVVDELDADIDEKGFVAWLGQVRRARAITFHATMQT